MREAGGSAWGRTAGRGSEAVIRRSPIAALQRTCPLALRGTPGAPRLSGRLPGSIRPAAHRSPHPPSEAPQPPVSGGRFAARAAKSSGRSRALRPIPAACRGSPQSFRPLPKAPRGGGTAAHLRETSVPRVRAHRARPASRGIASEALGEGPRISVRRCPPERGCRRSAGRERPDGPRARPRAQRAHRTRPG